MKNVEKMELTNRFKNRELNLRERAHSKVPMSNISLIMTILGKVSPDELKNVIKKMQQRHPILNCHLQISGRKVNFISNGSLDIPIKVIKREREDQWRDTILLEHKIPFEMEKGPLIRFILLESKDISDLIIFCQHTICDGISLIYLARDIMTYLSKPSKEVELLPPAPLVNRENIDQKIKPALTMRLLKGIIRKKWEKNEVLFDYEDFYEIHKVYWNIYEYKAHLLEFPEEYTKKFVLACREHDVTVNTALIAAFAIAQNKLHPESPKFLRNFASAANLRKLLLNPVSEQFGFFAGGIEFDYKYSKNDSLWDAARKIHKKINPKKSRKKILVQTITSFQLPQGLMDAQFFAAFGNLIPPRSPSYHKMQKFINNDKNIAVQIVKKRLSKGLVKAQIMTNLGKTNFPEKYGDLILKNLILMPSCSPYTEIVLGVVTHGGTLSITLNHMESSISSENVLKIKKMAREIILSAIND